MRKKYFSFLLSLFLFLFFTSSVYAKPRLAVRAFEDRSQEGDAPAGAIMNMMVTELSKANIFNLVERENLNYIADEIRLGQSGLMDPETAPKVGKIKGAQYTMTGAVTLYYYNEKANGIFLKVIGGAARAKTAYVLLDLRIIDNSTGDIVYAAEQLGTSQRDEKGALGYYQGFFIGGYKRTYGGILASATREAIVKHVSSIASQNWE